MASLLPRTKGRTVEIVMEECHLFEDRDFVCLSSEAHSMWHIVGPVLSHSRSMFDE